MYYTSDVAFFNATASMDLVRYRLTQPLLWATTAEAPPCPS